MCEPTTIMAVTTIAATGFTAQQQRKQGRFQKATADYNARVTENEAEEVRSAGVEEENIQRRRTAELLSKQRAQLGAANVDLSSGSALQLQEETQALGEADALRIRSNFENKADALDASAGLTSSEGSFAQSAGDTAAVGTLLSGTGTAVGLSQSTGVSSRWFTPQSAALSPNSGGL